MFPQTIIAFGHRKQVGKDSAAKFLCSYIRMNQNNSNCQIKGFADKVKDIAYQIYSWAGLMPGEYYESDETQKFKDIVLPAIGKTPRDLWIAVGMEFGPWILIGLGPNIYFVTAIVHN